MTAVLSPYHRKAAHTLYANVSRLVKESKSIGHLAFLTLTFADEVTDYKEAYRRYRSWNSNFFAKNQDYGKYINTKELQPQRGVWHYHIIVQVQEDIREGFDFEAYRQWLQGNNRFRSPCPTGNAYLRKLWREIRHNLEPYGLGRIHSLEPIESNEEAISRYIGQYISKTVGRREDSMKGARLVNYSRDWLRNSVKFAWNTENSAIWRKNVQKFATMNGCSDLYQLSEKLGSNWAYRYLDDIINVTEPYLEHKHFTWKHEEDGSRIRKDTGEVYTAEEFLHQDKTIKAISKNQLAKFHRLWAEARGDLGGRDTHKEVVKRQRKREDEKNQVERAKSEYLAFRAWLKSLPPAPF